MRDASGRTSNRRANYCTCSLLTLAYLLSSIGCSRRADDCHYNLTCGDFDPPDSGTGSTSSAGGTTSSGSTTNTGGTSAGGITGSGGISATGGQSTAVDACSNKCEALGQFCDANLRHCVECSEAYPCADSGTASICDISTYTCVNCLQNTDCPNSGKCNSSHRCVECLSNSDCSDPAKSTCTGQGICAPCGTSTDCAHLSSTQVCKMASSADAGTVGLCVQCTEADPSHCNGKSCDPTTNKCTSTAIGSVTSCGACVSDAECSDDTSKTNHPSARCVPMTFGASGRAHGSYCLQRAVNACPQPFTVKFNATSVSGAASEQYCGINQVTTTCEAVRDFMSSKACSRDAECGCSDATCSVTGEGGLCKDMGISPNPTRCTISCNVNTDCVAPPSLGSTCSSVTNGYCL